MATKYVNITDAIRTFILSIQQKTWLWIILVVALYMKSVLSPPGY